MALDKTLVEKLPSSIIDPIVEHLLRGIRTAEADKTEFAVSFTLTEEPVMKSQALVASGRAEAYREILFLLHKSGELKRG